MVVVNHFVLLRHFYVLVVSADVFDALAFEFGDSFGVEHELFELVVDALVGGLHVDDGAQFRLAQNLVVLRLASSDADDALCSAS